MRPGCSNGSVLCHEARIRIPPNYHNTAQASHLVDRRRLMKRNLPSGTKTGGSPTPPSLRMHLHGSSVLREGSASWRRQLLRSSEEPRIRERRRRPPRPDLNCGLLSRSGVTSRTDRQQKWRAREGTARIPERERESVWWMASKQPPDPPTASRQPTANSQQPTQQPRQPQRDPARGFRDLSHEAWLV